MNILYITNHLNIGGVTTYVFTLAAGLKKRGHNIFIASSGGVLLLKFIEEGIKFIHIPIRTKKEVGPKILACTFKLNKFLKQESIDIVHSNSRTTQVLASLIARKTGIVHITTWHGYFKRRIFRRLFPCWGKKVIAISEQVKEHLVEDFKVDEKDIVVINNGIDVNKLQAPSPQRKTEIKTTLGLGEGPVIGIVARLSDVKGHKYLIDAMKEVLASEPNAQLLIIGEGREKERLVRLARNLGITQSVFFVPEVSDTKDLLSVMDVFVMPSLKEGLGLALMEAMASGLPVVGSNVGGIKTLIKDGINGLLVEPTDIKGISGAISELLRNPQRAREMGAQARNFINENFSQDKMVIETEKVYLNVLKG